MHEVRSHKLCQLQFLSILSRVTNSETFQMAKQIA